jgi:hypothetical protein
MSELGVSADNKGLPESETVVSRVRGEKKSSAVGPIIVHKQALLARPTRCGKSSVQQSYFEKLWNYQGPSR